MKTWFVVAVAGLAAAWATPILSVDFENRSAGAYVESMGKQDFPSTPSSGSWYHGMDEGRSEIVDENGNKVLRVKYPKDCVGPNDSPIGCGIQIKENLPAEADTMWISYRILFESGFDFVMGGKLPGLCGSNCNTGGEKPTGYDGWSARLMWRTDGAVVQYIYFMDQPGTYAVDHWWNYTGSQQYFGTSAWHTLTTQIILNTPGQKDGVVRSWFDGTLSMVVDTIRFRMSDTMHIDQFYFSTFHGGSDASWAPTVDSYARYDDFVISTDSADVSMGTTALLHTAPAVDQAIGCMLRCGLDGRLNLGAWRSGTQLQILDLRGRELAQTVVASADHFLALADHAGRALFVRPLL